MRRTFLCNCVPGDVLEDVFVVTGKQFSATSTGKYFIKAFVSDRTSQVTARVWNASRDLFNALPESGFVRLRGRIENYQNNLQLIIEQMWPAKDGTFDVADLMPHTRHDIDQMCQRLFALCGTIRNRHVAALVQAFLDDEEMMNSFAKAPAAMSFHHSYIGGLLEHTLNAMEVANAVCGFYPLLNRDLVLAGVFLHDIAKTWELRYDCAFCYTDGGQLVGHVVKAAMWVEEKARSAQAALGEPLPRALVDSLEHIILSHHGEPEFGAARVPCTPEAIAVHMIENMDAKLNMSLNATRGEGVGEGNWTEYLKAFNGRLFRPDVAPCEDAPAGGGAEGHLEVASGQTSPHARTDEASGKAGSAPGGSPAQRPDPRRPGPDPRAASSAPTLDLALNNPLFEAVPPRRKS